MLVIELQLSGLPDIQQLLAAERLACRGKGMR